MTEYLVNMDGSWARVEDARKAYYVYVLRRPNGKVFYAGKGKGPRIDRHETEARTDCRCHKCNIIRSVWKRGESIIKEIVYSTNNERDALKYEAQLIQSMRDQLANVMDSDARLKRPQYRYHRRKPRKTAAQRRQERTRDAVNAINGLDRQMRRAILMRDEARQERIDTEIAAYRLWIYPPIQLQFEGF